MRKLLLATTAALGATVGIAGGANAGTLAPNAPNPAPGSITVTFNAVVEAFVFNESDTAKVRAESAGAGGYKATSYGIGTYSRLFPSFDGVLANGLKYGASMEIRHRSGVITQQPSGAAGGINTALSNTQAVLYNQREFLYLGADKFGKVLIGSAVQPTELFQTGNPANFNTGGWDGDLPGVFGSGLGYYLDDDNDQANKIVYVSPQFVGFDFGVSYEPNNFGRDFGGPGGARISSGNSSPQFGSRRSTGDAAVRYQGSFGSFGVKANVGGSYGGTVRSNIGAANRRDLEFLAGGVAVTFGGFEVDGHIDTGVYGRDLNPVNRGAKGTTAYVVGGSYTFGPFIVGANYYGYDTGENKNGVNAIGTNHAYGVAAGGTYTLAPGASVFLEYLYGHQKNNGYDLINSTPGPNNNKTQAQGVGIGTAFKW